MFPCCFCNDFFILTGVILAKNFLCGYYRLPSYGGIMSEMREIALRENNPKIIMYRCPRCNRVKQFSLWKHLNREELERLNYVDVEFKFVRCDMC
jgi:hypothetical protein